MRSSLRYVALPPFAFIAGLALAGCGSNPATPTPSPSPTAVPTASPTPPPTTMPSPFGQCVPTPPPLAKYAVKIHVNNGFKLVLDSRPVVGPDSAYCSTYAGTSGQFCSTAPEGDPRALPCDILITGNASDTGRPGPTWTWNGKPCFPIGSNMGGTPGCENHPDNQFLVIARGAGSYLACSSHGVCGGYDGPFYGTAEDPVVRP
jgi:hypothetical protein